ncbi:MAG: hypothetical protein R2789_00045 [Microthrixaceae bacterium]
MALDEADCMRIVDAAGNRPHRGGVPRVPPLHVFAALGEIVASGEKLMT